MPAKKTVSSPEDETLIETVSNLTRHVSNLTDSVNKESSSRILLTNWTKFGAIVTVILIFVVALLATRAFNAADDAKKAIQQVELDRFQRSKSFCYQQNEQANTAIKVQGDDAEARARDLIISAGAPFDSKSLAYLASQRAVSEAAARKIYKERDCSDEGIAEWSSHLPPIGDQTCQSDGQGYCLVDPNSPIGAPLPKSTTTTLKKKVTPTTKKRQTTTTTEKVSSTTKKPQSTTSTTTCVARVDGVCANL